MRVLCAGIDFNRAEREEEARSRQLSNWARKGLWEEEWKGGREEEERERKERRQEVSERQRPSPASQSRDQFEGTAPLFFFFFFFWSGNSPLHSGRRAETGSELPSSLCLLLPSSQPILSVKQSRDTQLALTSATFIIASSSRTSHIAGYRLFFLLLFLRLCLFFLS